MGIINEKKNNVGTPLTQRVTLPTSPQQYGGRETGVASLDSTGRVPHGHSTLNTSMFWVVVVVVVGRRPATSLILTGLE